MPKKIKAALGTPDTLISPISERPRTTIENNNGGKRNKSIAWNDNETKVFYYNPLL
jgi:hypothetical protein